MIRHLPATFHREWDVPQPSDPEQCRHKQWFGSGWLVSLRNAAEIPLYTCIKSKNPCASLVSSLPFRSFYDCDNKPFIDFDRGSEVTLDMGRPGYDPVIRMPLRTRCPPLLLRYGGGERCRCERGRALVPGR